MSESTTSLKLLGLVGFALVITGIIAATQAKSDEVSGPQLANFISTEAILNNLQRLDQIAIDTNPASPTRSMNSVGYNKSVDYIRDQLAIHTSLKVSVQYFSVNGTINLSPPELGSLTSGGVWSNYTEEDFLPMTNQGSADLTTPVYVALNQGCNAADYPGGANGRVTLVMRGICTFDAKVAMAISQGAGAVLIQNLAGEGPFSGPLGEPKERAAYGISHALGETFRGFPETTQVRVFSHTRRNDVITSNVLAETEGGRADAVVVVGAHLDSVDQGPGINDNGSGSSAILELAKNIHRIRITNKVRFAWWGAEEFGLLGSQFYVNSIRNPGGPDSISNIALNLNFDMIGSPNYMWAVYNGSSGNVAPNVTFGSVLIQGVLETYMKNNEIPFVMSPFDGRSDYGPFIAAGVPAGGLFTGAEGVKTVAQRDLFGGSAHVAYDSCYHQPCDSVKNINENSVDKMSKTAAFATQWLAQRNNLRDFLRPAGVQKQEELTVFQYQGPHKVI